MSPLRVIFAGTSDFAVPSLEALIADPAFEVALVITQPDKPAGRNQTLTAPPIKVVAEKHGIQVWQPVSINKEFHNSQFSTLHSQFLIVVSYGQILSKDILEWPEIAAVNVHASLLPRWRGASPIQHAILAGDRETGVTVQRMEAALDAGPILAQAATPLDPREMAATLHDRLATMGAELLVRTLRQPLSETPQPEEGVTVCRKLTRADGVVDPAAMTAEEIDRKVRALNPWPGVTAEIAGQTLKILQTALEPAGDAHPLPCKNGSTLSLIRVQPPGKKSMTGSAWNRGRANR